MVPELASEFPAGPEQVGRAALADLDSEVLDSADLVPADPEWVGPAAALGDLDSEDLDSADPVPVDRAPVDLEQVDLEQADRGRATSARGNRAARDKVVLAARAAREQ